MDDTHPNKFMKWIKTRKLLGFFSCKCRWNRSSLGLNLRSTYFINVLSTVSVLQFCLSWLYLLSCDEGQVNESILYTSRHSCHNPGLDLLAWQGDNSLTWVSLCLGGSCILPVGVQTLRAAFHRPCFMIIFTPQHCRSALHTTPICCLSPNPTLNFSACAGIVAKLRGCPRW